MIPWLGRKPLFPSVEQALAEPNGLLAAGGALDCEWLLAAYRRGIFPWFNADEPILWWSPNPRLVLYPEKIIVRRSLDKTLRNKAWTISIDQCFAEVMRACAAPRAGQQGTWISPAMQEAYLALHAQGYAHSVETWLDGQLVGGLYGVLLGRVFFGESMFSRMADASKVALVHWGRILQAAGVVLIDCQVPTAHLQSMGAELMSRADFSACLAAYAQVEGPVGLGAELWR